MKTLSPVCHAYAILPNGVFVLRLLILPLILSVLMLAGHYRPALAQNDAGSIDLGLTTRWRLEGLSNQFRGGLEGDDQLLAIRTLVDARYHLTNRLSFKLELADSRGYLDDEGSPLSTSFINTADILEANIHLDLKGLVGKGGYIRAGRFTRDIGGRRFIARNGFRNTINAFTGVDSLVELGVGKTFSAFAAIPIRRQPRDFNALRSNAQAFDHENDDLIFWGLHHQRPLTALGASLEVMLFGLHEKDDAGTGTRNRQLITPAVRLLKRGQKGQVDFEVEAAYQTGQARATSADSDTRDLDVSAAFLHGEIGYTFDHPWNWRIAAQVEHVSGEEDPTNGSFERYDTLFGVRRRDFNNTSIHGPLGRDNLEAVGIRLEFKHDDHRLDGRIHWLANRLASRTDASRALRLSDPSGASGRFIGHTVDSRIRYWVIPQKLRFEIGASILFKGRFTRTAPNAPDEGDTLYGYTQLTLSI